MASTMRRRHCRWIAAQRWGIWRCCGVGYPAALQRTPRHRRSTRGAARPVRSIACRSLGHRRARAAFGARNGTYGRGSATPIMPNHNDGSVKWGKGMGVKAFLTALAAQADRDRPLAFAGRRQVLDLARHCIDHIPVSGPTRRGRSLRNPPGQTLLVQGPPGAGKSALLYEIEAWVNSQPNSVSAQVDRTCWRGGNACFPWFPPNCGTPPKRLPGIPYRKPAAETQASLSSKGDGRGPPQKANRRPPASAPLNAGTDRLRTSAGWFSSSTKFKTFPRKAQES